MKIEYSVVFETVGDGKTEEDTLHEMSDILNNLVKDWAKDGTKLKYRIKKAE